MTVCLILTLLPATALAGDESSTTAASITDGAALKSALENADENAVIKLDSNVLLMDPITIRDKTLTLDMQGHTITYGADDTHLDAIIFLKGDADVTITGNGSFTYNKPYADRAGKTWGYTLNVYDTAKLTIKNGNFNAALTCVQLCDSSTAEILGGQFSADYTWDGRYWHLNRIDGSETTFLVKGGTFENYDPMNSDTESPTDNFCAPGYVSVADGDHYEVIPAVAEADGKYYATLGEAVAAVHEKTGDDRMAGTTIELLRDASGGGIGAGYETIQDGTTQGNDPVKFTLDLGRHTYTVTNPTVGSAGTETNGFQLLKDSVVTIQNGAIKTGISGIFIQNYCNLTLKDVDVTALQASYVMSNNCGDVNFIGSTSITSGTGYAFDVCATTHYPSGVTVNIDTTGTITGTILYDVWTAKPDPNLAKLNIKNGTFVGGFSVENALVEDAKENFSITGGRFSEKPDDAYLKVTGGAFVPDAQGYWTVGSKSGMEAEITTSGDTANVTVGGTFVPDKNGDNVDDEGNTITIDAGTAGAATSSTEVAISSDAMKSVSGGVYDVAIDTDVATVTVSDTAWDQITKNAQGQDVTIAVAKKGTANNPVYVLTAKAGEEEVFSSKNANGTITISVKAAAPANQIYYIREDGSLQDMNAQYDAKEGTLTWEVTHFSGYGEGSGKVGLVEDSTISFHDTVSAAIQAMTGTTGTITLLDNVTEDVTIPADKTIRLELNGKKITNETANHTIINNGTLTIQDSSKDQTGTVDNTVHAKGALVNTGTCTINGGMFTRSQEKGTSSGNGGNSWYVIDNPGKLTVTGGTVKNTSGYSSLLRNTGTMDVSGGTFENTFIALKNDEAGTAKRGTMNITGGTVISKTADAVQNWSTATISDEAVIQGQVGTWVYEYQGTVYAGTTDITGGTVNGDVCIGADGSYPLTNSNIVPSVTISGDAVVNGNLSYYNTGNAADSGIYGNIAMNGGTVNGNVINPADYGTITITGGTVTGQVTNSDNGGTITVTGGSFPNADVSEFVPNESCAVIFNCAGGDPIPSQVVAKGETITLPGCTHSSYHYKFDGWKCGNATYYAGDEVEVNSNMTFTAQWKERFPDGPSSGGSSSVSDNEYAVTVDAGKHGDVSVSPKWAEEGDTVTITADPDNGYVVDEVIVTDKNGDDIRVRDRGDGEYTFTMPDSKVTVEVTFVEAGDELSFVDVAKSDYYYDAVKWAVENGVTTGVTDTIFAPGNPCTRAQTVTFLWRAAGMPQAANRVNPFTDVSVNDYYYEAVLWAVENGITGGTTATTFSPNATCTRAQVVTFLWRYSKEDASILPMFTDVAEGDYYYGAVAWAVENGVTTGVTDTSFVPGNPCTRGQIVTFLYRYMGK